MSSGEKTNGAKGMVVKMMTDIKITAALEKLQRTLENAPKAARQEVLNALADCERALYRAAKRAEEVPEEFDRVEIVQTYGPKLEFTGKLLCEGKHETRGRDPLSIRMEIWQTQGGALIAASYAEPADRQGFETAQATVVEPQDDAQAMRFAVMDHFRWDSNARQMVVKKLKWSMRREVA